MEAVIVKGSSLVYSFYLLMTLSICRSFCSYFSLDRKILHYYQFLHMQYFINIKSHKVLLTTNQVFLRQLYNIKLMSEIIKTIMFMDSKFQKQMVSEKMQNSLSLFG